jgi:hypothetical protein
LVKFESNYQDEFAEVVVCYSGNLPASSFEVFKHQNNPESLFHVYTKDPTVNEFSFSHGEVLYYVRMKYLGKGVFNQIGYAD